MNNQEKNLTKEQVEQLFKKYYIKFELIGEHEGTTFTNNKPTYIWRAYERNNKMFATVTLNFEGLSCDGKLRDLEDFENILYDLNN